MENKDTLGLLYFGRLDDEKGFGLILKMLNLFIKKHGCIPFSFYVFGKGKYTKELMDLGQNHPSIHFFGWQPLDIIKKYKDNCHFCLVPSTFLETFGLTALNSLSMGIPVIGFSKGGLSQFVDKKYNISKFEGIDDGYKLFNLIESIVKDYNLGNIDFEKEKQKALDVAKKYTVDNWLKNTEDLLGKPKKVLLVSDFESKLGGIETYIHDVADILKNKGYEIEIYGTNIPNGVIGNLIRKFGLVLSMRNFVDGIRLKRKTRKFMPKVIRYHSTLRRLGWYPIKLLSSYDAKKIVMYHDLGYFHPYPSLVTQENMIFSPMSLKNFIRSGNTKNPIKIMAILFKYIGVSSIRKQLKNSVNRHLVPSEFMEPIVCNSFNIDSNKVKTFSHFIQ